MKIPSSYGGNIPPLCVDWAMCWVSPCPLWTYLVIVTLCQMSVLSSIMRYAKRKGTFRFSMQKGVLRKKNQAVYQQSLGRMLQVGRDRDEKQSARQGHAWLRETIFWQGIYVLISPPGDHWENCNLMSKATAGKVKKSAVTCPESLNTVGIQGLLSCLLCSPEFLIPPSVGWV